MYIYIVILKRIIVIIIAFKLGQGELRTMFRLLVFLSSCLISISGHGYLIEPAARSSAWLIDQDFKTCCTYNDHMAMYCGGTQTQWNKNG